MAREVWLRVVLRIRTASRRSSKYSEYVRKFERRTCNHDQYLGIIDLLCIVQWVRRQRQQQQSKTLNPRTLSTRIPREPKLLPSLARGRTSSNILLRWDTGDQPKPGYVNQIIEAGLHDAKVRLWAHAGGKFPYYTLMWHSLCSRSDCAVAPHAEGK